MWDQRLLIRSQILPAATSGSFPGSMWDDRGRRKRSAGGAVGGQRMKGKGGGRYVKTVDRTERSRCIKRCRVEGHVNKSEDSNGPQIARYISPGPR